MPLYGTFFLPPPFGFSFAQWSLFFSEWPYLSEKASFALFVLFGLFYRPSNRRFLLPPSAGFDAPPPLSLSSRVFFFPRLLFATFPKVVALRLSFFIISFPLFPLCRLNRYDATFFFPPPLHHESRPLDPSPFVLYCLPFGFFVRTLRVVASPSLLKLSKTIILIFPPFSLSVSSDNCLDAPFFIFSPLVTSVTL